MLFVINIWTTPLPITKNPQNSQQRGEQKDTTLIQHHQLLQSMLGIYTYIKI